MKATKIKKFLQENNAIIENEEDNNMNGVIEGKIFSVATYTGVRGNTIKGFLVKVDKVLNNYCVSQNDVIEFIKEEL